MFSHSFQTFSTCFRGSVCHFCFPENINTGIDTFYAGNINISGMYLYKAHWWHASLCADIYTPYNNFIRPVVNYHTDASWGIKPVYIFIPGKYPMNNLMAYILYMIYSSDWDYLRVTIVDYLTRSNSITGFMAQKKLVLWTQAPRAADHSQTAFAT